LRRAVLLTSLAACGGLTDPNAEGTDLQDSPNIIVILLDDIGPDRLADFGATVDLVDTPRLDQLADEGMRLSNAWAYPSCTPSRAALLTGKHAFSTGAGRWIHANSSTWQLAERHETLPELLPDGYSTIALGKWHLSTYMDGWQEHPNHSGFDYYAGIMSNPREGVNRPGKLSYFLWQKITNGRTEYTTNYLTADTVEDAEAALEQVFDPFFLYVALSAAHEPFHTPPENWRYSDPTDSPDDKENFDLMVESVDISVGRILDAIPEEELDHTWVFVLSDNGTPHTVIRSPYSASRAKLTLWEGGIRVPWWVRGPGVEPGAVMDERVHIVDLLPTVLDIAGADIPTRLPGRSLLPRLRGKDILSPKLDIAARFHPHGNPSPDELTMWGVAIRNDTHKLVADLDGGIRLHRLNGDEITEGERVNPARRSADDMQAVDELRNRLLDYFETGLGPVHPGVWQDLQDF